MRVLMTLIKMLLVLFNQLLLIIYYIYTSKSQLIILIIYTLPQHIHNIHNMLHYVYI